MKDQLTPAQRIRLEALGQATQSLMAKGGTSQDVIDRATMFAEFIKNGPKTDKTKQ